MSTPLANVILRGVRSAQPAAADVCAGSVYFVTDESITERSNGTIWESFSGAASSGLVQLDVQIATVDAQSMTFTGLDGNNDAVYLLVGRLKNNTGSACQYDWRPNDLATNQSSFRSATTFSSLVLGSLAGNGFVTFQAIIGAQANPDSVAYPRTYTGTCSEVTTAPTASGGAIGGIWTNTSTNITSIVVRASIALGISDGSTVALFRLA